MDHDQQARRSAAIDALFAPLRIKGLQLANRIVMAPMTRSFSPGGIPPAEMPAYYARRAAGGVGLIVTEGTGVDRPGARSDPNVPRFFGDALPAWRPVVDAVHAAGGAIAPQLWHVGASRSRTAGFAPPWESPSGRAPSGLEAGVAMDDAAIAATIAAFARAAAAACALGFDAIELHGAHGYLFDQFFWSRTNLRSDRWGGATLAERTRFAVEVVRAIRAAVGPAPVLIVRLSQFKLDDYDAKVAATPAEMEAWLAPLAGAGVDVFHCSQRRFWEPEFDGSDLNFAGWAKKLTAKPSITVGSVGLSGEFMGAIRGGENSVPASLDGLLRRLEREEFDLVAVGRALLADAEWPHKVRAGREDELIGYTNAHRATLT